ncbi:hypothetical protein ACHQM5_015141 [Ranunculus cassubicifolius]
MALAPFPSSSSFAPPSSTNGVGAITRTTKASLSSPFHSKRKNHLRLKLLKTLPPPLNPQFTPDSTNQTLKQDSDQNPTSIEEINEELQNVEVVSAIPEPEFVLTTRSVIELVLYIIGFFIVQTLINVWVMRSIEEDKRDKMSGNEEDKIGELGLIEKKKEGFWFGGSVEGKSESYVNVDVNEVGLEGKIGEIRAMAKKVREIEAKKLNDSGKSDVIEFDEDVGGKGIVGTKVKSGIQKEVDVKLSKLEKRLRSTRDKSLALKVSNLNNAGEVKDKKKVEGYDGKGKDENLVFKKKLKFKSDSSSPDDSPKGFGRDQNQEMINGSEKIANLDKDAKEKDENLMSKNSLEGFQSDHNRKVINGSKKLDHRNDVPNKGKSGVDNRKEEINSSSKELGSIEVTGAQIRKENKIPEKWEAMKVEENKPESGSVRATSATDSGKSKDSTKGKESDMWWVNLPYAMAITLQRSSEREGPRGFYSLKMEDGSRYIVAFEDNRDASHFCVILDIYFDELEDLSADVVPLSTSVLKDEAEASGLKVIVVRKGQLRLYAGQPLADVEMILQSLVK